MLLLVTTVEEQVKKLLLVQKMGGIFSLKFKRKGGNRQIKPNDFSISEVLNSAKDNSIHVIVRPVENPDRTMSIDGKTVIEKIHCGSRVISF